MNVTFIDTPHHLHPLVAKHHLHPLVAKHDCVISLLKVLGQPLILRSIEILRRIYDINIIKIPDKYPQGIKLLQDNFPSIDIEAFRDEGPEYDDHEKQIKTPHNDVQFKADDDDGDILTSSNPSGSGTIILENSMVHRKGKIKQ